jgi:thymidine phosphorylase
MDVKTGSGAFMKTREDSIALAKSLIGTGAAAGLKVHALITDMSEPLGRTAGNALEVYETLDYLANTDREPRLDDCVMSLAAEMLVVGGLAADRVEARAKAEQALTSGRAAEIFARMVSALGGPSDLLENPTAYLAKAPVVEPVFPTEPGNVSAVDNRAVGIAIIELGGGRRRVEDRIDPGVGFAEIAPIGSAVGPDRPLAMVHAASREAAQRAADSLRKAYVVRAEACSAGIVIDELLTAA